MQFDVLIKSSTCFADFHTSWFGSFTFIHLQLEGRSGSWVRAFPLYKHTTSAMKEGSGRIGCHLGLSPEVLWVLYTVRVSHKLVIPFKYFISQHLPLNDSGHEGMREKGNTNSNIRGASQLSLLAPKKKKKRQKCYCNCKHELLFLLPILL